MFGEDDAAYFKSAEFADCEVKINVWAEDEEVQAVLQPRGLQVSLELRAKQHPMTVMNFPGHKVMLCRCSYFGAQARDWQKDTTTRTGVSSSSSTCTVELTVDTEDQVPAAEAFIAALYNSTGALLQLQPKQVLHTALLADKHGVVAVRTHALDLLLSDAAAKLSALLDALAEQKTWPSFLLATIPTVLSSWQVLDAQSQSAYDQRIQTVLVAALGNLNGLWRDQAQQNVLLQLPLPAMRLLLESDQLIVDSEDTVYYTAVQYVSKQPASSRGQSSTLLAPLVRCSQLSLSCLSDVALTTDDSLLLSRYHPHLMRLLRLGLPVLNGPSNKRIKLAEMVAQNLSDAPASWQLGPREGQQQPEEVSVVWQLPMEELKQACRTSAADRKTVLLYSPHSPPMGGLAWQLTLQIEAHDKGDAKLGLYVHPVDAPKGTFLAYCCTAAAPQAKIVARLEAGGIEADSGWGRLDYFELGVMSGGWDEAAWAAKGLPTSGNLQLKLIMHRVGEVDSDSGLE